MLYRFPGVTSKLAFVGLLCGLNMMDGLLGLGVCVPEIRMMNVVCKGNSSEERHRTDEKSFHGDPLKRVGQNYSSTLLHQSSHANAEPAIVSFATIIVSTNSASS